MNNERHLNNYSDYSLYCSHHIYYKTVSFSEKTKERERYIVKDSLEETLHATYTKQIEENLNTGMPYIKWAIDLISAHISSSDTFPLKLDDVLFKLNKGIELEPNSATTLKEYTSSSLQQGW